MSFGGGAGGGATWGALAGLGLAPFTMGMSVPVGMAIGAGVGAATGSVVDLFKTPDMPDVPPTPSSPLTAINTAGKEAAIAEAARLRKRRGMKSTILTGSDDSALLDQNQLQKATMLG